MDTVEGRWISTKHDQLWLENMFSKLLFAPIKNMRNYLRFFRLRSTVKKCHKLVGAVVKHRYVDDTFPSKVVVKGSKLAKVIHYNNLW